MSFDAIGIVCEDLSKSIEFYSLFGLKFEKFGEGDHVEATTKSGVRLMLDSETLMKQIDPNWKPPTGSRIGLCFIQENPNKVDELFNALITKGFKADKEPWDAFWGQRYAIVLDPDGNQTSIFANL